MKKILNFFKYTSISYIYLLLFVLSQTFSLFGIMYYKLFTDIEFVEKFVDIFEPLYNKIGNSYEKYITNAPDILTGYTELLNTVLIPVLTISNLFVIIIIIFKIFRDFKKKNIVVVKKIKLPEIFKYIGLGVLINFVISLFISFLPTNLIESHEAATSFALNGNPFLLVLASGILAPLAEELVFRYGMQKNLIKINPIFGIVFQAFLFGLLHGNLVQSSYAFLLGLIFGTIDYKKGNILYSIILHIAINTSSVLVATTNINEFIGMISFIVISFVLYLIFNKKENIK